MKQSKILIAIVILSIAFLAYKIYDIFFVPGLPSEIVDNPTYEDDDKDDNQEKNPIDNDKEDNNQENNNSQEDDNSKIDDKGSSIFENIYLKFDNNKNYINPSVNNDNLIFTLKGDNNSNNDLYFEIKLNYEHSDSDNKFKNSDLSFALIELSDSNSVITNTEIGEFNTINDRIIYIDTISKLSSINKKYQLKVVSKNTSVIYDNINVNVNIGLTKNNMPIKGSKIVLDYINSHANIIWRDTSDNVIYFSGKNNSINNNYVWYSGKLWRITAIYPDGTMKLITDNNMTTISWGKSIEYNGSWVYQWLNEDFYDTLYNPINILVTDANWNYTTDSNTIPKKPETLPNQKNVKAPVGLLSSYEYYNAYRNSKYSDNYLNISHYWWHITPQHSDAVRGTNNDGKQDLYDRNPSRPARGIRPVIYLNKNVEFTGSGSKTNPYRIMGDISTPNYNNTLLNNRISGEYVLFDNKVYRIVDVTANTTKIIMVDYLRDGKKAIEKHIARTIYYGKPTNTQNSEWWDYYLINVWYPTISPSYRKMLVDGTYYLGSYPLSTSYKNTICVGNNLDTVTVKNCPKYSDSNHLYISKVGLPRIGEMFTAQQLDYEAYPPSLWTLTPFDDIENRIVHESNTLWHHKTWGGFHVAHPTLYLNGNVKIIGGTGLFNSPYLISE